MQLVRRILAFGVGVLLLIGGVVLVSHREDVADWMALRNYQPPSNISRLASDATMTDYAKKLFYINQPQLEPRDSFNQHCTNDIEQSVVLGCYHGSRRGIYLYDVTDARLHGVQQTTAAHEMLHQAYDRLDGRERAKLDAMIEDYYKNGLDDQAVKDQIESYKQSEPDALDNEMHSLFGTEIGNLPADLEHYYKRYFNDRSKVVGFNVAYQSEFTRRKQQVADYDQQLESLKKQIETKEQSLDDRQSAIRQKKAQLDRETAANQIDAYNADVATYNAMAQAYNQELSATKNLINKYNSLVEQRNAIAVQEQQLQQALDSRLTPVGGR